MRWLLLDRIDELVPGEHALGVKAWTYSEPYFQDHFPGFPVVPGVLLLESMAQLSGKLIGYTVRKQRGDWPFPIFSMAEKVKFRRFVKPGQVVQVHSRFISLRDESAAMRVRATLDGKVVAQAEETFVFNAVKLEDPGEAERVERLERKALALLWEGLPAEDR
ncbi:MAG TPA: 3-hydroxyacyl-ACP dehydratase FabZ family protein [Myxococcota bacterium]|nr:3-hydroxyacyl-ACP dehydratase FabZ family protein [Myxococcota bacterium]